MPMAIAPSVTGKSAIKYQTEVVGHSCQLLSFVLTNSGDLKPDVPRKALKINGIVVAMRLLQLGTEAEMEHLSLSTLSLLCSEPIIRDPEEQRHLRCCPHCMKLLLWFADEQIDELEKCEETSPAFLEREPALTAVH
jgi:hypothetical protein